MDTPRIFLGSPGKQQKLLQALTRGLEDNAPVVRKHPRERGRSHDSNSRMSASWSE